MPGDEILPSGARRSHTPNPFAGGSLDRAAHRRSDPAWVAEQRGAAGARVVPVWRSRSLVASGEGDGRARRASLALPAGRARPHVVEEREWILLGLDERGPLFAAEVREEAGGTALGELGEFLDLHRIGATLGQADGALLAYARAVVTWSLGHRYCGRCGHPTRPREGGHVRRCENPDCGADHFPRTDPAIIVLVADGARCLLGRKDGWPEEVYSTLAGFVEPGESLGEAVAREVREESGIEVGDVRYRSSQPWPFPSSLMLGFHAERAGGELRPDPHELADARWFDRDEIVERVRRDEGLPSSVSIARRLIEEWLAER